MALVLRNIYNTYYFLFNEYQDPRTVNWPLLGSPVKVFLIIAAYLYFVKRAGPKFMAHREPFNLKYVLIIYNLLQVVSNLWLGIYAYYWSYWQDTWNFKCQLVNYSATELGIREAFCVYLYFILKIVDFLDTIFFVLRKKSKQITFLHLYHHVVMVVALYLGTKFIPGGHGALLGIVNCYVHAIMYFYYFLTAFRPNLRNSMWWKKYITHIQMVQFTIFVIFFGRPLIMQDCDYPNIAIFVAFVQNIFMLLLFGDFYFKAYIKKNKSIKDATKTD